MTINIKKLYEAIRKDNPSDKMKIHEKQVVEKKEEEDLTKPARNLLKRIHKATDKDTLEKLTDQLEKDTVSGKIAAEQETRLKAAIDRRGKKLEANPETPEEEPTQEEEKELDECINKK